MLKKSDLCCRNLLLPKLINRSITYFMLMEKVQSAKTSYVIQRKQNARREYRSTHRITNKKCFGSNGSRFLAKS